MFLSRSLADLLTPFRMDKTSLDKSRRAWGFHKGTPHDHTKVCGPLELCDIRLVEHFCDQLIQRFERIHATCSAWNLSPLSGGQPSKRFEARKRADANIASGSLFLNTFTLTKNEFKELVFLAQLPRAVELQKYGRKHTRRAFTALKRLVTKCCTTTKITTHRFHKDVRAKV